MSRKPTKTEHSCSHVFNSDVRYGAECRLLSSFDYFEETKLMGGHEAITLLEEISKGRFGRVYRGAYSGSKNDVAIKVLDVLEGIQEQINLLCELSVLQGVPSDRFVKFLGARFLQEGKMMIVMELCENGVLRDAICHKQLPWNLRVRLVLDAAQGLTFLHQRQIIHRDIKPTNILIDKHARARICGFAFCVHADSGRDQRKQLFGTREFMAPEVLGGGPACIESDIFSLGILLAEVLTGINPSSNFLYRNEENGFAVDEKEIAKEVIAQCPPSLEALAYLCCSISCGQRPTAEQSVIELSAILKDLGGTFEYDWNSELGVRAIPLCVSAAGQELEGDSVYPGSVMGWTREGTKPSTSSSPSIASNSSGQCATSHEGSGCSASPSVSGGTSRHPPSPTNEEILSRFNLMDSQIQELRAENERLSQDLQGMALASATSHGEVPVPLAIVKGGNAPLDSKSTALPPLPTAPLNQDIPQSSAPVPSAPASADSLALILSTMSGLGQQMGTLISVVTSLQSQLDLAQGRLSKLEEGGTPMRAPVPSFRASDQSDQPSACHPTSFIQVPVPRSEPPYSGSPAWDEPIATLDIDLSNPHPTQQRSFSNSNPPLLQSSALPSSSLHSVLHSVSSSYTPSSSAPRQALLPWAQTSPSQIATQSHHSNISTASATRVSELSQAFGSFLSIIEQCTDRPGSGQLKDSPMRSPVGPSPTTPFSASKPKNQSRAHSGRPITSDRLDPSKVYRAYFSDFTDLTGTARRPMLAKFNKDSEPFLTYGNKGSPEKQRIARARDGIVDG